LLGAPRSDPDKRDYRIRLLRRVLPLNRTSGHQTSWLRAASRTRSNPCDTSFRLCVRSVFRCPELLFVGRLPSIASFTFGDFSGTTRPSDFSRPFISALRPWPSLRGTLGLAPTCNREISRFPRKKFRLHAPLFDRAGPSQNSRFRSGRCCLPLSRPTASATDTLASFRGSITRPADPLSTLGPTPHGIRPMTRGQVGSLLLSLSNISVSLLAGLPALRARTPALPLIA